MSDATHFRADGDTFVAEFDGERLGTQLERVLHFYRVRPPPPPDPQQPVQEELFPGGAR